MRTDMVSSDGVTKSSEQIICPSKRMTTKLLKRWHRFLRGLVLASMRLMAAWSITIVSRGIIVSIMGISIVGLSL